ncbi:inner membrane transporter RhtA [Nocardia amikacinitolerans]|nr:inner membrane transporter RhtA [Nocardia amikacinitolerans]
MPTGYSQCARPQFGRHFATGEDLRGNRTVNFLLLWVPSFRLVVVTSVEIPPRTFPPLPTRSPVDRVPAPLLVLGAMVSIQLGAAVAKQLFALAGADVVACLRIVVAGALGLLIWRPAFRVDRRALPGIAGLGIAIAAMNLSFYAAIERIPLGVAVTIEFLGPLTVALLGSRRLRDALWALTAGAGVLLLMDSGGPMSWTGVLFALLAGAGWGAYIACGAVVGRHTAGHDGLALAMAFGGALALPFLVTQGGSALLDPMLLAGVAVVAVCSSLVPHAIELTALRRIEASVFGVWMSSQPAVAAVAGMVLLGEGLRGAQWGGVAMVVVAAAGSAWFAADSGRRAQDEMARRGRTDALSADAEPLRTGAGATSEVLRPERAAPELVH